jgi:site-specific DNA-methyltransferase (adenine-specific)
MLSFVGETVLDPFGGVGSTAVAALELERRAELVDQNQAYLDIAKQRLKDAAYDLSEAKLKLGDSRNLDHITDESIDLIVTSPPYWDKADYGGKESDVGTAANYADFLLEMGEVYSECFRVLKPGRKICVVTANVNQMTDHGLLSCIILRQLGFVMINEVIWSKDGTGGRWGSANGQRPIFGSYPYPPNFLFKTVHEYILVFQKPKQAKSKGAKVRSYQELMMPSSNYRDAAE